MGVLEQILASKRREISERLPLALSASKTASLRKPSIANLCEQLARRPGEPLRLLAEIKRRSPSAGPLSTLLSVAERAQCYARGGVAVISVLTDQEFFGGSFDDLRTVAETVSTPVLCKDFVLDARQIQQAAEAGATLILLIMRIVPDDASLRALTDAARERGLEPLFEVATEAELERALTMNPRIIGVNARDLDTLTMNQDQAAAVLQQIPHDVIALHLSGLHAPADIRAIASSRADGALVGEALMRCDDPTLLLSHLMQATGEPNR